MAEIELSDELRVGVDRMDDVHAEFAEVYNALARATDAGFVEALDRLIAHCEDHFAMENAWMAVTDFPGCHRAEHDRVLSVISDIRRRALKGDLALGRQLVKEIPDWFAIHATGMDAALAFFLKGIDFDFERGVPPKGWRAANGDDSASRG